MPSYTSYMYGLISLAHVYCVVHVGLNKAQGDGMRVNDSVPHLRLIFL